VNRWIGRLGGVEGNQRLTEALALVLLVLLAVESATTLDLSAYLALHIFLGLVLLPAVSLKLASTGWRATRYYTGAADYRAKGPPLPLLRLLAPPLVAATVVLFGTGVAFLVTGTGGGLLLTLHAASFAVWGLIMIVHLLSYLKRVLSDGLADWQPQHTHTLAGARLRQTLLFGSLVMGAALALATLSAQSAWRSHHHGHHHDRGRSARSESG
jgi:hypothetical protein